jgi:hypothetical protein
VRDFSGENYIFSIKGKLLNEVHGVWLASAYADVWVRKEDSLGFPLFTLYSRETQKAVSPHYSGVGEWSEGLLPVMKNHLWGYVDSSGKEVIPCRYAAAAPFSEGLALVTLVSTGPDGPRDRKVFIDRAGKTVAAIDLKGLQLAGRNADFKKGLLKVKLPNGREGYLGKNGREYIYH